MSGFVGIWNRDGRPVDPPILLALGETMAHRAPEEQALWIETEIGLSARLLRVTPESALEVQPAIHPFGSVLVFDGRLDNRDELLNSLPRSLSVPADAPDSAIVLAAYQLHGDRLPEMLLGDFAFALFDSRRRRLLLARDAIGLRPLYYWQGANTFVFASEIKAILAHPAVPARPNDDMVALMAAWRYSEEDPDLTFFDGVSRLPPSHLAVVEPESFSVKSYWDFDPAKRVQLGSFTEYVEGFRHYFEQSVRRRMRSSGPVAVSLSGGLDSSSIFCLAETLRRSSPNRLPAVHGITYTSDNGSSFDENQFLRDIENQYHVSVMRVPPQRMSMLGGAEYQLWHGEMPYLTLLWPYFEAVLKMSRQSGARVLLLGNGGDETLLDQAYLIDLLRGFKWRTAWIHLRERPSWSTNSARGTFLGLFVRELAQYHLHPKVIQGTRRLLAIRRKLGRVTTADSLFSESLLARARAQWKSSSAPRATTANAKALYDWLRFPQQTRAHEWNNKIAASFGIDLAIPFVDRDLLTFHMSIPGEVQSQDGVPKALLRKAMRDVLPLSIVERRWKGDATDNTNEGVARDFPEIEGILQAGVAAELGYVKSHTMSRELGRLHYQLHDTISAAARIRDLVALERWLRLFFFRSTHLKESSDAFSQ